MNSSSADSHDLPAILCDLLACPACRSDVTIHVSQSAFWCASCSRLYPVYHGIPDFRLSADPYIAIENEYRKAERILGDGSSSLSEMIDRYYDLTPEVSPRLQERYKKGLLSGVARGEEFLKAMPSQPEFPLLDIGCGTGGLMVAAGKNGGAPIIGVDIAMRWLCIGQQRLIENNQHPLLVCANAESLPFRANAFACVVSESTLEHSNSPQRFLEEASRVAQSGAPFYLQTTNRNSLVEPYTGFPLPSLLPTSRRNRIIARVCKTPYLLNPMSRSQLFALLRPLATDIAIHAHLPMSGHLSGDSALKRFFFANYKNMIGTSMGNRILASMGMFLAISGKFK